MVVVTEFTDLNPVILLVHKINYFKNFISKF